MSKDASFEALARVVTKNADVKVHFVEGASPHSNVEEKTIVLPNKAKTVSLDKRIELLCYLLHEIGHIRKSRANPHAGGEAAIYANLLEDMCIQEEIESYFSGSRAIYERVIRKVIKDKPVDKLDVRQKLLDHVLIKFTDIGADIAYDKDIAVKISQLWPEIVDIYEKYKVSHNAVANIKGQIGWYEPNAKKCSMLANSMRTLLEGLVDDEKIQQSRDNISKLEREADRLDREASNPQSYAESDFEKLTNKTRDEKTASMDRTKKLKEAASNAVDKATKKQISKMMKQEQEYRSKITAKKMDAKADLEEGIGQRFDEAGEKKAAAKKLEAQTGKLRPNSCCGLNRLDEQFFCEDAVTLKQGTYASLKRLFEQIKSVIKPADFGKLDEKKLSEVFTRDDVFSEEPIVPDVKANIEFLLDNSGSMGWPDCKMSDEQRKSARRFSKRYGHDPDKKADIDMCWLSFESLVKNLNKLSVHEYGDIRYAASWFGTEFGPMKELKHRHSEDRLKKMAKAYFNNCGGGTELMAPLKKISKRLAKTDGRKFVFIITDGGFHDKEIMASSWFKKARRAGIKYLVIGIRTGNEQKVLGHARPQSVDDLKDLEPCLAGEIKREMR